VSIPDESVESRQVGAPPTPVPYPEHEREVLWLIDERDAFHRMADKLAAALAPPEVLGEHSSMNDPWENALNYAEQKRPTA
jgi:hypothetical protein